MAKKKYNSNSLYHKDRKAYYAQKEAEASTQQPELTYNDVFSSRENIEKSIGMVG